MHLYMYRLIDHSCVRWSSAVHLPPAMVKQERRVIVIGAGRPPSPYSRAYLAFSQAGMAFL